MTITSRIVLREEREVSCAMMRHVIFNDRCETHDDHDPEIRLVFCARYEEPKNLTPVSSPSAPLNIVAAPLFTRICNTFFNNTGSISRNSVISPYLQSLESEPSVIARSPCDNSYNVKTAFFCPVTSI